MAKQKYQHTVQESPATTGEVEKDTSKVAWVSWRRQVQKCTKMEEICAVRLVAVDRKHTHQTNHISQSCRLAIRYLEACAKRVLLIVGVDDVYLLHVVRSGRKYSIRAIRYA